MGKNNRSTLDYIRRNDIFADLLNGELFHGKEFIHPELLHDDDPKGLAPEYAIEKESDVVKVLCKSDAHARYLIFQIEAQNATDLTMPMRTLLYVGLNYHHQVQNITSEHKKKNDLKGSVERLSGMAREDRLIPVIPAVLYLGPGRWEGPRSIHEMLDIPEEIDASLIPNFEIKIIEPGAMDEEDFSAFRTSLKNILPLIKSSGNKDEIRRLVESDPFFQDVPREEANFLRDVLNMKIEIPKRGNVNMCKGLEDWIAEERKAERAEVRAEYQSKIEELQEAQVGAQTEIEELKAQLKAERALREESDARADRFEKALKSKHMLV